MLLRPEFRRGRFSRHVWLAAGLFVCIAAPDIGWNLAGGHGAQATYVDHLSRIGGLGLSPYPVAYYARSAVAWLHGSSFADYAPEYETMNPLLGLILLGGVAAAAAGRVSSKIRPLLLTFFGAVFGSFLLIRPGHPSKDLDPVAWGWVDMTLLPAAILTGAVLAAAEGRERMIVRPAACAAMLYAVARMAA